MRVKNKGIQCAKDGCDLEAYTKSFCKKHYQEYHHFQKTGKERNSRLPARKECIIANCGVKHYMNGCCRKHWDKLKKVCTVEQYNTLVGFVSNAKSCTVEGCVAIADSKLMCFKHYNQVRLTGSIYSEERKQGRKAKYATKQEAFESKIDKEKVAGCWLWKGTFVKGYSYFFWNRQTYKAHRYAYSEFYKQELNNERLNWKCTNHMTCVNPEHMQISTRDTKQACDKHFHRKHKYLSPSLTYSEVESLKEFGLKEYYNDEHDYFNEESDDIYD